MNARAAIANHLYAELSVGQSMTDTRIFTAREMELMSALSGIPTSSQSWNGIVLAFIMGERFPGPGSVPLALELNVLKPVAAGSKILTRSIVREKRPPDVVVLEITASNCDSGELVFSGTATVRAPAE